MNPVSLFFFCWKEILQCHIFLVSRCCFKLYRVEVNCYPTLTTTTRIPPPPQKNQIIYQLIKLINHCSFIYNYYWKSIDRSIDNKLFESNECDIYLTKNYDNLRIMERKLNAREREFIMPNDNIWKFFFFFLSFWWSNWFKSSIHTH